MAVAHREVAGELVNALELADVRVDVDERDETLGKRIRDAELQKIPYVVVWGDRETREAMAVRRRGGEGVSNMSLDTLVDEIAAAGPA
jgi:threonyl-tRNA synthetase